MIDDISGIFNDCIGAIKLSLMVNTLDSDNELNTLPVAT